MEQFSIFLGVEKFMFIGLKALDICRQYNLEESLRLQSNNTQQHNIVVGEAVAREFFGDEQLVDYAWIPLRLCTPADVRSTQGKCDLRDDLPTARYIELYRAAKYQEARKE